MIKRRVRRIVARLNDRSGAQHLNDDLIKRLQPVSSDVLVAPVMGPDAADEIANTLHSDFPWLGSAIDAVWQALRLSAVRGDQGVRIPPLLLAGSPGIGKSIWARRLGDLIGVPTGLIEATSEPASFSLVGSQKGWVSAGSGKPLDLILRTRIANPVFIIDEVEKASRVTSSGGGAYDLASALLPLLERESSRAWQCPYLQVPFDMSLINWILTGNDAAALPAPLRSRVTIKDLPPLTIGQILTFTQEEGTRCNLSELSIEVAIEALAQSRGDRDAPSLRTAIRVLDRAEVLQTRPRPH